MYPGCRQVLALSRLSTDPATEFGPRRGEGRTSLAQGMKQRLTSADLGRTDALAQKHSQGDRACLQAEPGTRRRAGSWEELLGRKASATARPELGGRAQLCGTHRRGSLMKTESWRE